MSTDRQRDADVDRLLRATLGREPAAMPDACPDAGMLAAYVEGAVQADERAAIETHMAACGRCQDVIAAMDLEPLPTAPALVPAAVTAGERRPWLWRGHLHWLIPVGAGALLVVFVASRSAIAPSFPQVGPPLTFPPTGQASTQMAELRQAEPPAAEMPAAPPLPAAPPAAPPAALTREKNAAPARAPETAPRNALGSAPARSKGERSAVAPQANVAAGAPVIAPAPAAAQAAAAADAVPPAGDQKKGVVADRALRNAATEVIQVSAPGGAIQWRVGAAGTIWRSADEGLTWYPQRSGVKTALLAAAAPSISTCWAVGADGTVLLTDNGERWERRPFPEPTDLVAVEASSAHDATVTTRDGRRFATTDRGATWTLQRQLP